MSRLMSPFVPSPIDALTGRERDSSIFVDEFWIKVGLCLLAYSRSPPVIRVQERHGQTHLGPAVAALRQLGSTLGCVPSSEEVGPVLCAPVRQVVITPSLLIGTTKTLHSADKAVLWTQKSSAEAPLRASPCLGKLLERV